MALVALTIHAGLLAWGAACHSPAIDEIGHMAAGLGIWHKGRFDLYCVNPPLVRAVATLPVALGEMPPPNWARYPVVHPSVRPEASIGREWIESNGPAAFAAFTLARLACIPFSLLGGAVCFFWARALYGAGAGTLACLLWCSCPFILGNAQMITPDTAAAAIGVTAAFAFRFWLRRPGWIRSFLAGIALGFAALTKTTLLLWFGLWPVIWAVWRRPRSGAASCFWEMLQLSMLFAVALNIINLGYCFDGSLQRLREFEFISEPLRDKPRDDEPTLANRFCRSWLGDLPVPLPRYYAMGIDVQKRELENRTDSYLRGEWRDEGWWYYYLYGLAVKTPCGTLILAGLALTLSLQQGFRAADWRDELMLLLPPVIFLAFISAQTGFNHHLRYILPILPFGYVWLGKLARIFQEGHRLSRSMRRWLQVLAALAFTWTIVSSLRVCPHSLSYFHELAGGPAHGHVHLLDSNLDWGQDLFFFKKWLDAHPEASPMHLAYFGYFDPRSAGVSFELPAMVPFETGPGTPGIVPEPGWYAISANLLYGFRYPVPDGTGGNVASERSSFAYLRQFQPVARAGYSILIYHLRDQDVDALLPRDGRRRLEKNR